MNWLKSVLIDIAVTAVIAFYAWQRPEWAYWVILIYSPLMLLLKLGALSTGVTKPIKKKKDDGPPDWFFHGLYGVSVLLLLSARWWWMVAVWAAIWILSAVAESRKASRRSAKR